MERSRQKSPLIPNSLMIGGSLLAGLLWACDKTHFEEIFNVLVFWTPFFIGLVLIDIAPRLARRMPHRPGVLDRRLRVIWLFIVAAAVVFWGRNVVTAEYTTMCPVVKRSDEKNPERIGPVIKGVAHSTRSMTSWTYYCRVVLKGEISEEVYAMIPSHDLSALKKIDEIAVKVVQKRFSGRRFYAQLPGA
jgi:hypothetical protein